MSEFKFGREYGAKDAGKGKALNILEILNVTFLQEWQKKNSTMQYKSIFLQEQLHI